MERTLEMRWNKFLLVGTFLCAVLVAAPVSAQTPIPISELPADGATVTVKGRTGYIVKKLEEGNLKVFTLRDDYNDSVFVRAQINEYPIMGTTYRITGTVGTGPGPDGTDVRILEAAPTGIARVYKETNLVPVYAFAALLVAAGVGAAFYFLRPPAIWGNLILMSGPEAGRTFPLRGSRIPIGRGADPVKGVLLSDTDRSVSRNHGVITRTRGRVSYKDTSARGSRVRGEQLKEGESCELRTGDTIVLGEHRTVLMFRNVGDKPADDAAGATVREEIRDEAVIGEQSTQPAGMATISQPED